MYNPAVGGALPPLFGVKRAESWSPRSAEEWMPEHLTGRKLAQFWRGSSFPLLPCTPVPTARVGVGKLSEPQNPEEGGRAEEQAGAFVSGLGLAVIRGFTAVTNGRSLKGFMALEMRSSRPGPSPRRVRDAGQDPGGFA